MSQSAKKPRTIGFWRKWLKSAQQHKAYKRHQRETKAAWDEYEMASRASDNFEDSVPRAYPIYYASSQILGPSLYSRTPEAAPKRLHGIEDKLALTMELIDKRLGQYNMDHGDFDEGMIGARDELMHGAKATTQVICEFETEPERRPLSTDINGDLFDEEEPYDGEAEKDEEGYFYTGKKIIQDSIKIRLASVPFDEILHTPNAKTPSEIKELAYRFCLPKEEAEEMFNRDENGKSLKLKLPYRRNNKEEDSEAAGYESSELVLMGWECYDIKTKMTYWVCEDYPDACLKIEPDRWELDGFFPSPKFKITNRPRKFLYPTPSFVYLESTLNQLHVLYHRVHGLIDAIRRRALVYGASAELIKALNDLDGQQFIAMPDINTILDKGGLKELIQFIPVQELVESLSEAMHVEDHLKNLLYEWFGVPDIKRGASDPNETAKAQELKNENANDRFKFLRKQIIDLARDSAQMMNDLAYKVYSDQRIAQIVGLEFFERGKPAIPPSPGQPPSKDNPQGVPPNPGKPAEPSHYELFPEALARLRNDKIRMVRIDFETDSTNFRDQEYDIQHAKMLQETVLNGLATIGGIQNPQYIPITLTLLMTVVESMGGSTLVQNMVRTAVKEIADIKNQPPPPPPPDYEGMKVEIAAQKVKYDAMKSQSEAQAKQAETQVKMIEAHAKQQQAQIDAVLANVELSLRSKEVDLAGQKVMGDQALAQAKEEFSQKLEIVLANQEQQKIEIEKSTAALSATESLLEEERLTRQAMLDLIEHQVNLKIAKYEADSVAREAAKSKEKPEKAPSAIHVHLGGEKETSYEYDNAGRVTKSRSKSK